MHRISISPSMLIAAVLCAAHVAAAGLLWAMPVPMAAKAVLTLAVAASMVVLLARDALLHAGSSIVALEVRDGGEVAAQTRRGDWLDCELLGSSYVSHRLTILNLRPRGRWATRRVLLVPDNVDARDFRRLRVWLRWKYEPETAVAGSENLTKR
jgi:toxin CptA